MGMGEISESVEITVKTIGPAPPSRLSVSSPIKVRDLRKLIATSSANHLPIENLRLVFRGKVLDDTQDDDDRDDVYLQLSNGVIAAVILLICYVGSFYTYSLDSVIAAVKPKPPPRHLRDDTCIDDDDLDLILGTAFSIIFLNLGQRQPGDMSAYSIFNDDFRELPGTLNADRLDRDIRAAYCDHWASINAKNYNLGLEQMAMLNMMAYATLV
ncbi:ubiquitin-like domain-containing protein [Citrus sinensis]|nr:ubiquitin-like domain-containing protein [Citrus sinensis]